MMLIQPSYTGSTEENKTPRALIQTYARSPSWANIFNYASMAFNNNFFFQGISSQIKPPTHSRDSSHPSSPPTPFPLTSQPPEKLANALTKSFHSLDTLRSDFLATANAMCGPGYVWLCKIRPTTGSAHHFAILTTYNAGTPLLGAHHRQQPVDTNVHNPSSMPANTVGYMGQYAAKQTVALGAPVELFPVLCVSTWQHVYVRDWGVSGKREFLDAWWERVNWEVVDQLAGYVDSEGKGRWPGFGDRNGRFIRD